MTFGVSPQFTIAEPEAPQTNPNPAFNEDVERTTPTAATTGEMLVNTLILATIAVLVINALS